MLTNSEKRRIRILVSNDDGIDAAGLKTLVDALSAVADVYVSAPDGERSAKSHSITSKRPIHIRKTEMANTVYAMTTDGTPSDCVKSAINILRENGIEIDVVYSGINHGANLGVDTLYSGTVAAAVEGALCGKPAVAVSVCSHTATHFDYAAELAVRCLDMLDEKSLLNINVADIPYDEVKGVRITKLGSIDYKPWFRAVEGSDRGLSDLDVKYVYRGTAVYHDTDDEIDTVAITKGYASITPLDYDFTDNKRIAEMKRWGL